uniref:Uncharacterized protein n=1 Tax=Steinernema glaseri TaxID=37863 RepID=A0A1I7Z4K3_9BILA
MELEALLEATSLDMVLARWSRHSPMDMVMEFTVDSEEDTS